MNATNEKAFNQGASERLDSFFYIQIETKITVCYINSASYRSMVRSDLWFLKWFVIKKAMDETSKCEVTQVASDGRYNQIHVLQSSIWRGLSPIGGPQLRAFPSPFIRRIPIKACIHQYFVSVCPDLTFHWLLSTCSYSHHLRYAVLMQKLNVQNLSIKNALIYLYQNVVQSTQHLFIPVPVC